MAAAKIRQSDLTRALKAAQVAGLKVRTVEINQLAGTIALHTDAAAGNDADAILASWEKQRRHAR